MPAKRALRQEWMAAGYRFDMGSAAVVPPPQQGFVRVYHLTSADFAISNIGLGRIKVARFLDLNDPFELMALNFNEQPTRKIVQNFRNTYDSHTGLLCFSADWTNPVLWSHYGAKHRGICLGFDVAKDGAQEVRYEDKRLLEGLGEAEGNPLKLDTRPQEMLLCTKFRHWQYEQEIRVFVKLNQLSRKAVALQSFR